MAEQIIMAQVDAANQVSQLLAASGSKTFTVGNIASATANGGSMVTFTPAGGGNAIAVKVGTAKAAGLSSLTGKTVAISKPSLLAGTGMGNNWLMMQPVM